MLIACSHCKQRKPATEEFFRKHKQKLNGLDSWCRQCYRDTSKLRKGRYRKMITDDGLRYLLENVTECVICGHVGRLNVDHDHETNEIRGMLCHKCNTGLGMFMDDPDLLEFARIYLLASKDSKESTRYLRGRK